MRNILLTISLAGISLAGILLAGCSALTPQPPIKYGTHEVFGSQNLPQNFISHADVTLNATPSQILAVNLNRVDAPCVNKGSNSATIGDSAIGASQGTPIAAGASATVEATSAIYGYSASGTTVNCGEEVRP